MPCSQIEVRTITPNGHVAALTDFVVDLTRVLAFDLDDGRLLARINDSLRLGLTPEDLRSVVNESDHSRKRRRLSRIRHAANDEERLLLAAGEEALRQVIPAQAVKTIERETGRPLRGEDLAKAAKAAAGPEILTRLRPALEQNKLAPPTRLTGTDTARSYVKDLGFSEEYAGLETRSRDAFLEVEGPASLPPLHEYQRRVLERIRHLLRGADRSSRGMVSLPTGAGKTRRRRSSHSSRGGRRPRRSCSLIAQTDELCEQAVDTWAFVWRCAGPPSRLRISRLWADNDAEPFDDGFHLVVATDSKLLSVMKREDYDWLSNATVVMVDEAHTSISPKYTEVLDWLGRGRIRRDRPLIGLTATAFRGVSQQETDRLAARYDRNRLDDGAFDRDPHQQLQDMGVLARVRHDLLKGADLTLTQDELHELATTRRLPASVECRLSMSNDRNETIIESVLSLPEDWTVLLFATSVENATVLATLLTHKGIPARSVSGQTNRGIRRHYVEEFRRGRIRVLTNYSVLVQGFDAPAVRAVYVTRPTFSPNVYQQMIGRGLRGPLNGGSEEVLIVNVDDNFQQYGEQLAFHDFDHLWVEE